MRPEHVLGRKLVLEKENHDFYFTVREVIYINDIYILFLDRDLHQVFVRWKDVKGVI